MSSTPARCGGSVSGLLRPPELCVLERTKRNSCPCSFVIASAPTLDIHRESKHLHNNVVINEVPCEVKIIEQPQEEDVEVDPVDEARDSLKPESTSKFSRRWKWLMKKYKGPSKHGSSSNLKARADAKGTSAKDLTELNRAQNTDDKGDVLPTNHLRVGSVSPVPNMTQSQSSIGWNNRNNDDLETDEFGDVIGHSSSPNSPLPAGQGDRIDGTQRSNSTKRLLQRGVSLSGGDNGEVCNSDRFNPGVLTESGEDVGGDQHGVDSKRPPAVKVGTEKTRLSKITTEVREKLSVFHRTAGSSNIGQVPFNSTGPHASYCPVLNKVFRSRWPTPEEVEQWGQSFDHVLHDKYGILVFREFLRSEFSDENIEFWLSCEHFRNNVGSRKLQSRAQKIFQEYVAVQSKREVNLDSTTRSQLEKELDSITRSSFDQCQKRIQHLMEKDSYSRFMRSDLYLATLELSREAQEANRRSPNMRNTTATVHMESSVRGLLPDVHSGREMATQSNQHTTGSTSAPSSPKLPKANAVRPT